MKYFHRNAATVLIHSGIGKRKNFSSNPRGIATEISSSLNTNIINSIFYLMNRIVCEFLLYKNQNQIYLF